MTNMPHKINHSSKYDHILENINAREGALNSLVSLGILTLTAIIAPVSSTYAYTELENGKEYIDIDLTGGTSSEGVMISAGGTTFDDVKVAITDNRSHTSNETTTALNVQHGKETTITGNFSVINTVPLEGRGGNANNNAVFVQGGSTLTFDENTESVFIAALGNTNSGSAAISAKNTTNSNKGNNTVTVQGKKVQIIGDLDVRTSRFDELLNPSTSTINLTLSSADSFWYGDQRKVPIFLPNNSVNLTLSNGAEWIYFSESSIANLTLLDGGIVNLVDADIEQKLSSKITDPNTGIEINLPDYELGAAKRHYEVSIGNLKGSGGIFKMDLSHAGNSSTDYFRPNSNSDYIVVTGSSETGTHLVVFDGEAANISNLEIGDRIYFARVEDKNAEFITNHDGISYRADEPLDFVYGTESEFTSNLNYWYFTKKGNATGAYQGFMKAAVFASYSLATDLDRFNDRRGESRYVNDTNDGLWVRNTYSNLDWDNAFEMDKNMIQIGYDRVVGTNSGKHILGVSVDYTNANIDIPGVTGGSDSERYAMSLYYTWLSDTGIYTDLVLKGGVIDSDYAVSNAAGASIGSDIKQNFYGVSLESGWKFDFANKLFVEPQVQFQCIHLEGDDFTSDGGVKANLGDINSFIGRAGARAGYQFTFGNDLPDSLVYVKADILHEFSADRDYKLQGSTLPYSEEFSGSQTWFDAGISADLSISQNTKLWLDAAHIFGGDYENSWRFTAGARYEF